MFANSYKRIFHFHLRKCGGTSLNAWLQWHVPDLQCWVDPDPRAFNAARIDSNSERELAAVSFYRAPAVYTHRAFIDQAPPDTFRFTVLRRPVPRVISQVADWRREFADGHYIASEGIGDAVRDAATLRLKDFLERHATSTLAHYFDNYQVRALAATAGNPEPWRSRHVGNLLERAKHALRDDYEAVGLTERMRETRELICSRLGLVPDAVGAGDRNVTRGARVSDDEIHEAADILRKLTVFDEEAYSFAESLLEKKLSEGARYQEKDFEELHLARAVERLRPVPKGQDTVISVRECIIGSGFWGRDASGCPNCAVWTGPSTRSVLYFPCPAGVQIQAKLWIRGYASPLQRGRLRFEINDRPARHEFQSDASCHEVAVVPAISQHPYLKLTILLDATVTSSEAGYGDGDLRARGVSLDRYGWSFDG